MKRIISLLLALTLLVGSMAVLSSCGNKNGGGAEIAVYLGNEVYDLDPGDYYVSDNAAQFMRLLFEPLFSVNEKGKLEMAAAEDYEIDEEKREIAITLRESYWSDGNAVMPNDFVSAWKRLLDPDNANPAAALLYDIENAYEAKNGLISSVDDVAAYNKGDNKTILITYRENANVDQLLQNLASIATAPVRHSVVEIYPGFWSKSIATIVTNGAFKIASYDVEDGEICLERNTGYRQSADSKRADKVVKPYKLVNFWAPNAKLATLTYDDIEKKTVFYLGEATAEARKNETLAKKAETHDMLSTFTLAFVSENELFNDVKVRQAMSMALDRNAIAAALVYAKAATAFVPHDTMGVKGPAFNPTKLFETSANTTAAAALLPDAAKGATVKLTLNDDADGKIIGALVETAWEAIGLAVEVKYQKHKISQVYDNALGEEAPKYDSYVQYIVKTVAEGGTLAAADKCDVVGFEWQMYSTDPFVGLASLSSIMCGNGVDFADGMGANGAPVASEEDALLPPLALWDADKQTEYDGLIKAAFEAQDEATRVNKLAAAAGLIADQCPVIPVVFNQSVSVIGKGLSGVEFDYFGIASFTKAKLAKYEKYLVYEDQKSEK